MEDFGAFVFYLKEDICEVVMFFPYKQQYPFVFYLTLMTHLPLSTVNGYLSIYGLFMLYKWVLLGFIFFISIFKI